MRWQGLVKNRITGEVRRTRLYRTYKEAHTQAESLGRRVYGKNYNWEIDVITKEVYQNEKNPSIFQSVQKD